MSGWKFDLPDRRMWTDDYEAGLYQGLGGSYQIVSVIPKKREADTEPRADNLGEIETNRVAESARAALQEHLALER